MCLYLGIVLGYVRSVGGTESKNAFSSSVDYISTNYHGLLQSRQLKSVKVLLKLGIDLLQDIAKHTHGSSLLLECFHKNALGWHTHFI